MVETSGIGSASQSYRGASPRKNSFEREVEAHIKALRSGDSKVREEAFFALDELTKSDNISLELKAEIVKSLVKS